MSRATDLAMLDPDELEGRLAEARRELLNLRFQLATGQLDNTSRLGTVRREVARIMTVRRARELAEAAGSYVAPSAAEQATARANLSAAAEREATARAAAAGDATGEEA